MASSINRLAIILALLTGYVDAVRVRHSFAPEDTFAFPKYRLNFVNNRPISPQDAQVFISNGFATDEHEFFGRPPISPGAIEGSGEWAQEEKTIQDVRAFGSFFFWVFRLIEPCGL